MTSQPLSSGFPYIRGIFFSFLSVHSWLRFESLLSNMDPEGFVVEVGDATNQAAFSSQRASLHLLKTPTSSWMNLMYPIRSSYYKGTSNKGRLLRKSSATLADKYVKPDINRGTCDENGEVGHGIFIMCIISPCLSLQLGQLFAAGIHSGQLHTVLSLQLDYYIYYPKMVVIDSNCSFPQLDYCPQMVVIVSNCSFPRQW